MEINLTPTVTHLNNHTLLPPSSLYLAIRASIIRVIRMSGRGEKYEKYWKEFHDSDGLASDGSTPHLLNLAIITAGYRIAIATNWSEREDDMEEEECSEDRNDVDESTTSNPPPPPSVINGD